MVNLIRMNKAKDFDYPGWVWGDDKSIFSVCENDAKAVTRDATRRHVDRDFFAAHIVSRLYPERDYFLEYQRGWFSRCVMTVKPTIMSRLVGMMSSC
ncbi:putative oxidoreductase [Serratia liquefaciens]|nr:putative oxidoreductase [Serratia liquefaciens]